MKKLITLILCLCFALTAVGCGDRGNGGDGGLDGVTYNERTGEMYKDTKDGKTRIKISYTPGFGNDWAKQISRAFLLDEAGANYYIELDNDSELTTSISTKLESGTDLSDIYWPLASNWYSYAALDYLENLDELYNTTIPGEDKTILEKMTGTWKTYGKAVNNQETHYYVFPGTENITGIVYNKTLFDQYGWEVPTTAAELKTLCAEIVSDTNGKIAPFVYPGTLPGGYWDFIGTTWWLQATGAEQMDEFMKFENSEVFNHLSGPSEGKLAMLETFEDIIVKNRTTYTLKGSASKTHLQAQLSFAQKQAAMIPNGNWIEKESLSGMKDEVRMMPVPYIENALEDEQGNKINYNYSGQPDYIMIPKAAPNKVGAKAFLAFMCKDEMLKMYTEQTGTPRPFEYDLDGCETSDFIASCLEIAKNSTTWFENSTSKLWTANKVKKFNTNNPYSTLLANSDTISAIGWCASEYNAVKLTWDSWLNEIA